MDIEHLLEMLLILEYQVNDNGLLTVMRLKQDTIQMLDIVQRRKHLVGYVQVLLAQ